MAHTSAMAIRVYAETSVYGGVFDAGIDAASREFFAQVRSGRFALIVSAVVGPTHRCLVSTLGRHERSLQQVVETTVERFERSGGLRRGTAYAWPTMGFPGFRYRYFSKRNRKRGSASRHGVLRAR